MILLGWAGCKDKHLSKYSSIYNEQVTLCWASGAPDAGAERIWVRAIHRSHSPLHRPLREFWVLVLA